MAAVEDALGLAAGGLLGLLTHPVGGAAFLAGAGLGIDGRCCEEQGEGEEQVLHGCLVCLSESHFYEMTGRNVQCPTHGEHVCPFCFAVVAFDAYIDAWIFLGGKFCVRVHVSNIGGCTDGTCWGVLGAH